MRADTREESFLDRIVEYCDISDMPKTYSVHPPQVGVPGVHSACASRFIAHFVPIGVESVTLDGAPIPFHTRCWHTNAQGGIQCVHVDFSTPFLLAGDSASFPELVLHWPKHEDEGDDKKTSLFTTEIELNWEVMPGTSRIDFGSLVPVPSIFGELCMLGDDLLYNCNEVEVVGSSAFFARVVDALAEACDPPCYMLWDERDDAGHFGTWMPLLAHRKCSIGWFEDMYRSRNGIKFEPPEDTVSFIPSSPQSCLSIATATHSKWSPECTYLCEEFEGLDLVTKMIRATLDPDDYTSGSFGHFLIVEEEDGAAWPKVFHNHMWQTLILP